MPKGIDLRTTFNTEAALYRAIRPCYPEALFDALVKTTALRDDARLLEIGPGAGQATESLAKRGFAIVAVEIGEDLAAVAREALNQYANVHIVTGAFEEAEFPPESFDLVYAATALHWIKPEVRFSKPHQLLKAGGSLAVISTHHVSDEAGDAFFFASQPIYKQHKPGGTYDDNLCLTRSAELTPDAVDENIFAPVRFDVFPLAVRYSATEYIQLLSTYSPTLSMESDKRAHFLGDIEMLIEDKFDGSIVKHYAMTLTIAKKRS